MVKGLLLQINAFQLHGNSYRIASKMQYFYFLKALIFPTNNYDFGYIFRRNRPFYRFFLLSFALLSFCTSLFFVIEKRSVLNLKYAPLFRIPSYSIFRLFSSLTPLITLNRCFIYVGSWHLFCISFAFLKQTPIKSHFYRFHRHYFIR